MVVKDYYIGMYVHKEYVQMAVFTGSGEDPVYERRLTNDTELLTKEMLRYSREGKTIGYALV